MSKDMLANLLSKELPFKKRLLIKKGKVIIKAGQSADGIFIIRKGIVKYTAYKNRKKITIAYEGPGSIHSSDLLMGFRTPFTLESLTALEADFISKEVLEEKLQPTQRSSLLSEMLADARINLFANELILLLTADTPSLIARCIVNLSDLNGEDHVKEITRKEIAEFANCSVEYAFRTLTRFKNEGLLAIEKKKITLLNKKTLALIANGKAK